MLRERRIGSLFNGEIINAITTFKHVYIDGVYSYSKINTNIQYIANESENFREHDFYIGIKQGSNIRRLRFDGSEDAYKLYYDDDLMYIYDSEFFTSDYKFYIAINPDVTFYSANSTVLSDDKTRLYVHKIVNENMYITKINTITCSYNNKDITDEFKTGTIPYHIGGTRLSFTYPTNTSLTLSFEYIFMEYIGWNEDEGNVYSEQIYYYSKNIPANTSTFIISLPVGDHPEDKNGTCYTIRLTPLYYDGMYYPFGKDDTPIKFDNWV